MIHGVSYVTLATGTSKYVQKKLYVNPGSERLRMSLRVKMYKHSFFELSVVYVGIPYKY